MTDPALARSIRYQEISEGALTTIRTLFQNGVDGSVVIPSLDVIICSRLENGILQTTMKGNDRFLWGGNEIGFRFVIAVQINLLRQRINELLKEIDPSHCWRGNSSINPGEVIITHTRD